ncbi:MAG TPA: 2'-5' RNA ligase family protein [Candidatus Saccharimonadales bacterium]|nr:2'-5' RNA ligase family protein [Candidatus Saccharimonadales bacterium]
MSQKVYICCDCPAKFLREGLRPEAGNLPRHVTIIHPIEVSDAPSEGFHQPAQEVIEVVDYAIQGVQPFSLALVGLKEHPNADETSRVVSLKVGHCAELDLIRERCVDQLNRYVNPAFLFDFHVAVAKDLTAAASQAWLENYVQTNGEFEPTKVPIVSIEVYLESGDGWRLQASRRLKP